MREKGFTLAEILVVIAVISILGLLIVTIFSRTLRGTNKSQIISAIKQNGQAVLEDMDKTIRGADNLVCISNDPQNSIVVIKGGKYIRYRFQIYPDKSSNGVVFQDNPIAGINDSDPRLFINKVCNPRDAMSAAQTLTDNNPQTGVNLISGTFKKSDPQSGFKDVISIQFVLGPGVEAAKAIAGQIDEVSFQTSIELR